MSKRKQKNPNGKLEHQERLAQNLEPHSSPEEAALAAQQINGISSPKLVNRPKFRGTVPKMRPLVFRPNQQHFIDTLQHPEAKIVVLTGPAGTGKTLLAVRKGLEGILNGRFADLILCRPLVEAGGEEMGYLPGNVDEKIGPYLEPFYDKLTAFLPDPTLKALLAAKHISAAPLAFMRGRTFSESFMIIDEAQNTTVEQIKMAVTRLGPFSKIVICGDPDQTDIRGMNGLQYLTILLEREGRKAEINGCHLCRLGVEDIQRNSVIPYLLTAFSQFKARQREKETHAPNDDRLAQLFERTLKQILHKHTPPRMRSPRGPAYLQGDLFENRQPVNLQNQ